MENKNMTGNTEEGFKAKVFAMREEVTIDKKNLMIGDWVKDPIDNEIVWQWESCDYEDIEVDVLPIPITPEILEANGFYRDCANIWEYVGNHYDPLIRFDVEYTCMVIDYDGQYISCNTMYVHELQHALRILGLNEIADGFKLE